MVHVRDDGYIANVFSYVSHSSDAQSEVIALSETLDVSTYRVTLPVREGTALRLAFFCLRLFMLSHDAVPRFDATLHKEQFPLTPPG